MIVSKGVKFGALLLLAVGFLAYYFSQNEEPVQILLSKDECLNVVTVLNAGRFGNNIWEYVELLVLSRKFKQVSSNRIIPFHIRKVLRHYLTSKFPPYCSILRPLNSIKIPTELAVIL